MKGACVTRTLLTCVISAVMSFTSCGSAPKKLDIPREFEHLYGLFIKLANDNGQLYHVDNLVIRFANNLGMTTLNHKTVGLCTTEGDEPPLIEIDAVEWYKFTDAEQEELLFHELGHCLLNRDHDETYLTNNIPSSIMYPDVIRNDIYIKYRAYYWKELFK